MKYYLDEKGNVIEEPESIREHLRKKSPELAQKLESLISFKINVNSYTQFLYNYPSEEELKSNEKRSQNWEEYIEAINSQLELRQVLPFINLLKNHEMDITDDKVLVVHSERPFFDSLLIETEKRIGHAEGWIGKVESYDLTDVENAKFFSADGKIYQRFVLREARKLLEEELKEWVSSKILVIRHHDFTEPFDVCVKKLDKSPLGNERIVVYDKYPNIDHFILEHILKEDEKQVAHISVEEAERINILPYYGPKKISHAHLTLFTRYKDSKDQYGIVFVGEDPRNILEIYMQIKDPLEAIMHQQFNAKPELEDAHMYIAKYIKNFITSEQREKARNAPLMDKNKWLKKYIDEQGLKITDKTIVGITVFGPHDKGVDIEARQELIEILGNVLVPQGYIKTNMDLTYGWDRYCRGKLSAETSFDFGWDPDLYAGELVINIPKNR